METKLKKSSFQEISGIFPDLLTLKVNIKYHMNIICIRVMRN